MDNIFEALAYFEIYDSSLPERMAKAEIANSGRFIELYNLGKREGNQRIVDTAYTQMKRYLSELTAFLHGFQDEPELWRQVKDQISVLEKMIEYHNSIKQ